MANTNEYYVHGWFDDKNYSYDNDKPIKLASSRYDLVIEAEDMKKAYDIAIEYMPAGAYIREISLNNNPRGYRGHINAF